MVQHEAPELALSDRRFHFIFPLSSLTRLHHRNSSWLKVVHIGVNEKHQRSRRRDGMDILSKSWSSCGISSSNSPNVGASALSRRRSRSYSSAARTTTTGCPLRVTCCGSSARAAFTMALNLLLASCNGHSVNSFLWFDGMARRSDWSIHQVAVRRYGQGCGEGLGACQAKKC